MSDEEKAFIICLLICFALGMVGGMITMIVIGGL